MTRVYTADMGQPPMDPEVAPPSPKKKAPVAKKAAPKGIRGGVWTEDSGVPVPQDIDGGSVKYAKGGSVGSASRRADGIARKGKTKGRVL